jgi:hypothetical protein
MPSCLDFCAIGGASLRFAFGLCLFLRRPHEWIMVYKNV